jgi:hypothetical protein
VESERSGNPPPLTGWEPSQVWSTQFGGRRLTTLRTANAPRVEFLQTALETHFLVRVVILQEIHSVHSSPCYTYIVAN